MMEEISRKKIVTLVKAAKKIAIDKALVPEVK